MAIRAQPMQSGLAVVEELARRFTAGAFEAAFELYHPALRIEQPASLPHGGIHEGHAGVRSMGARFAEHWDRTIEDPRRMAAGDGVVQITTQTWTAKSTGRSATVDVVELLTVADGQVTEIRVFPHDTQRLLATLERAVPEVHLWQRNPELALVDAGTVAALGRHWEEGWNGEDVDTIVAPFARDVIFSSPFVPVITGDPSVTTLHGIEAVRRYVADSFRRATRGIKYTLHETYVGTGLVTLRYTVHHPTRGDLPGADTMRLCADGKVVEWRCQYPFAS